MNIFIKAIHKIVGCDPQLARKNSVDIEQLKRKILFGTKKITNDVKNANGVMKLIIERGELEFKIAKK